MANNLSLKLNYQDKSINSIILDATSSSFNNVVLKGNDFEFFNSSGVRTYEIQCYFKFSENYLIDVYYVYKVIENVDGFISFRENSIIFGNILTANSAELNFNFSSRFGNNIESFIKGIQRLEPEFFIKTFDEQYISFYEYTYDTTEIHFITTFNFFNILNNHIKCIEQSNITLNCKTFDEQNLELFYQTYVTYQISAAFINNTQVSNINLNIIGKSFYFLNIILNSNKIILGRLDCNITGLIYYEKVAKIDTYKGYFFAGSIEGIEWSKINLKYITNYRNEFTFYIQGLEFFHLNSCNSSRENNILTSKIKGINSNIINCIFLQNYKNRISLAFKITRKYELNVNVFLTITYRISCFILKKETKSINCAFKYGDNFSINFYTKVREYGELLAKVISRKNNIINYFIFINVQYELNFEVSFRQNNRINSKYYVKCLNDKIFIVSFRQNNRLNYFIIAKCRNDKIFEVSFRQNNILTFYIYGIENFKITVLCRTLNSPQINAFWQTFDFFNINGRIRVREPYYLTVKYLHKLQHDINFLVSKRQQNRLTIQIYVDYLARINVQVRSRIFYGINLNFIQTKSRIEIDVNIIFKLDEKLIFSIYTGASNELLIFNNVYETAELNLFITGMIPFYQLEHLNAQIICYKQFKDTFPDTQVVESDLLL